MLGGVTGCSFFNISGSGLMDSFNGLLDFGVEGALLLRVLGINDRSVVGVRVSGLEGLSGIDFFSSEARGD